MKLKKCPFRKNVIPALYAGRCGFKSYRMLMDKPVISITYLFIAIILGGMYNRLCNQEKDYQLTGDNPTRAGGRVFLGFS